MWRTVSSELRSLAQRRSALKPSGSVAGGIALRDQTLTFTQSSPTSSLIQKAASLFTYQANDILRKRVEEVAPSLEPKRQHECRAMMPETMSVLGSMVGMPQHLQSLCRFQQSGGSIKALDYWRLPKDATLKDVSTVTRADEANYQFVNHFSSEKELTGSEPTSMRLSRPLSPHLPVYVPQRNSLVSIFNRIAAAFLAGEILFVYLLVKMGAVSMTNFYFYDILFNVSKLSLISAEISALALFYHVLATFLH